MSNRSPGAHSAAELNIKESSKAGMNGDATIGRHRRLETKFTIQSSVGLSRDILEKNRDDTQATYV